MNGQPETAIQSAIRQVHEQIVALHHAGTHDASSGIPLRPALPSIQDRNEPGIEEPTGSRAINENGAAGLDETEGWEDSSGWGMDTAPVDVSGSNAASSQNALLALDKLVGALAPMAPVPLDARLEHLLSELAQLGESDPRFSDSLGRLRNALDAGASASPVETGKTQALTGQPDEADEGRDPCLASIFSLADDPELIGDFIQETTEHLASIETLTLVIERAPEDRESLNALFRSFHSIKGLAGFLELHAIREMAHQVETQLDRARNGELQMGSNAIDCILASTDFIRCGVNALAERLRGKQVALPGLDERLRTAIMALSNPSPVDESSQRASSEPYPEAVEVSSSGKIAGDQPIGEPASTTTIPERAAGIISPACEAAPPAVGPAQRHQPTGVVKVETAKLDYLVDMVGEFVIAQAIVRHDPSLSLAEHPRLQRNLAQMARVTAEIQRTAMSMRMVPIHGLFQRMARLVRDLSRKTAKQVEFLQTGEETELDRNLIEQLADPLMHMVRNSVDHGMESVEQRIEAGKSPSGTVHLRASHESGGIVIEIIDDGRGLNREKILQRAIDRGLLPAAANPPDADVWALIFEPGFSTAEAVTDLSGRGVGMDVVRRNIQQLRGRVEIESERGRGTRISLRLPLTLAIIDGLLVGVGTERFILPMYAVREMFRPTEGSIQRITGGGELVDVRGRLLAIERLYRVLEIPPKTKNAHDALLVVLESQSGTFCVMVDEFLGKQEVVIKPLGAAFQQVAAVSAGAILGDGKVALILDLDGLGGTRARRGEPPENRSFREFVPSSGKTPHSGNRGAAAHPKECTPA